MKCNFSLRYILFSIKHTRTSLHVETSPPVPNNVSKVKALKRCQRMATALVRYYLQKGLILFPLPTDKKERTRHLILDRTPDLVTNALSF